MSCGSSSDSRIAGNSWTLTGVTVSSSVKSAVVVAFRAIEGDSELLKK